MLFVLTVWCEEGYLFIPYFVSITFGSWNCFCSFWSASALIIVICTIKFRLSQMLLFQTFFQQLLHYLCSVPPFIWDIFRFTVTNVILYLFCKFSYSDDNNDFSLNVVKYSLWSVEWDSWYLNSGCWFSFFPSRVFTEVSHHCWGLWSDKYEDVSCLLLNGIFCLFSGVPSWRSLRRKVYTSHTLSWFHFFCFI